MPDSLRFLAVLALAALLASPAAAHKLKVFATAQGATISGYVYLSGGTRPAGVPLTVRTPDDSVVATLTAGAEGRFSFEATRRVAHTIVAETDGHRGTWTVPAKDLPAHLPGPAQSFTAPPARPRPPTAAAAASDAELRALVEEAVARQVAPLREQLKATEDTLRWHDVLGGLGWIAGLFGGAAWLGARRRSR